jgi:carboxyl-terminal processing protease
MDEEKKKTTKIRRKKKEKKTEIKNEPEKKEIEKAVIKNEEIKEEKHEEVPVKTEKKKKRISKSEFIKDGYSLTEVVLLMIATLLLGLFFGGYFAFNKYNNKNVDCKSVDEEASEIINVYNDIKNSYYGEVDKEKLVNYAIQGMLVGLGDPYALYVDSRDAVDLDEELKGSFTGLGIRIIANENNQIEIIEIFADSPAEKNGLKVGDIITKMDSKEYTGETMKDLTYTIKTSKVGTVKKLEIIRNGETITKDISLETVIITTVYSHLEEKDGKKIGVIQVTSFTENVYDQFVKEYEKFKAENISSLVIDLRQNGGGYLSSANSLLSLFLDKNMVSYQRTDGVNAEEVINDTEKKIKIPVVLLVDGGTASSSEVFASSLVDNLNVPVVGTKTYGKGTIQKLIQLSNGSYIKYTVQEWLTPKGNKIEGVGITPTYVVELEDNAKTDKQLEKAVDIAKGL